MSDKEKPVSVSSSISRFEANRPNRVIISVEAEMSTPLVNGMLGSARDFLDKGCKPCGFNGMDIELRFVNPVIR